MSAETDAERAYLAFAAKTGWQNEQGLPMPAWQDLTPQVRGGWIAAAAAGRGGPAPAEARAPEERR